MPGLGGISLWAKNHASVHADFVFSGRAAFSHVDEVYGKEARVASPHHALPPELHLSHIKAGSHRASPLCAKPAGHRRCVCQHFPRVHQQRLPRADGPLRYGGVILWGPLRSHRHRDQLCPPPAIGQGSCNRRSGGRGRGPDVDGGAC